MYFYNEIIVVNAVHKYLNYRPLTPLLIKIIMMSLDIIARCNKIFLMFNEPQ